MTETTVVAESLSPAVARFVLHWGDLGSQWGVNRSVAQIHALLYLAEAPMTAEDIADALGLARSNVSNSIKELLAWKLIRRLPMAGDRRDHYQAETDLWEMVTRIAQGRKQREIDPAYAALRASVTEAEQDRRVSTVALERLRAMLAFVETLNRWHDQMLSLPKSTLATLIKMGAGVTRFLSPGKEGKATKK